MKRNLSIRKIYRRKQTERYHHIVNLYSKHPSDGNVLVNVYWLILFSILKRSCDPFLKILISIIGIS